MDVVVSQQVGVDAPSRARRRRRCCRRAAPRASRTASSSCRSRLSRRCRALDSSRSVARRSVTSTRTPATVPPREGANRSQISRVSPSGRTMRYSTSLGSPRAARWQASAKATASSGCTAGGPGLGAVGPAQQRAAPGPATCPRHEPSGCRRPEYGTVPVAAAMRASDVAASRWARQNAARRQNARPQTSSSQTPPSPLTWTAAPTRRPARPGARGGASARAAFYVPRRPRPGSGFRRRGRGAIAATARSASSMLRQSGGHSRSAVGETAFTSTCSVVSRRRRPRRVAGASSTAISSPGRAPSATPGTPASRSRRCAPTRSALLDQALALDRVEHRQAAAATGGVPPNVVAWSPRREAVADLVARPARRSGGPTPRPLASVMASGSTPSRWNAEPRAERPMPVCTSSRSAARRVGRTAPAPRPGSRRQRADAALALHGLEQHRRGVSGRRPPAARRGRCGGTCGKPAGSGANGAFSALRPGGRQRRRACGRGTSPRGRRSRASRRRRGPPRRRASLIAASFASAPELQKNARAEARAAVQPLGERDGGLRPVQVGDMPEAECLLGERRDRRRVAVTERAHREAGDQVEVRPALLVPDACSRPRGRARAGARDTSAAARPRRAGAARRSRAHQRPAAPIRTGRRRPTARRRTPRASAASRRSHCRGRGCADWGSACRSRRARPARR